MSQVKTITVSMSSGYERDPASNECGTLYNAIEYFISSIVSGHWNNRPVYDEDAGVFVPQEKYSARGSAYEFAAIALDQQLLPRLRVTDEEHDSLEAANKDAYEHGKYKSISISREFSEMEIVHIIQVLFVYLENLKEIYQTNERDLYESDNHYTGKPLSEFLEKAKQEASKDHEAIMSLIKKLGDSN